MGTPSETVSVLSESEIATDVVIARYRDEEHLAGIQYVAGNYVVREVVSRQGKKFALRCFIVGVSYRDGLEMHGSSDPVALVLAHSEHRSHLLNALWPAMAKFPEHWCHHVQCEGGLLAAIDTEVTHESWHVIG